ncbi:MAG TPA: acetylglutamate kinase [Spirochaetia bacterium]|nr:acetylglutamate kinase [Spirochaetia bacterium]
MNDDIVAVKIGGRPATDDAGQRLFARELASELLNCRVVVVHGGGAEVSRVSKLLGLEPTFRDGIRMTSPAEMDVVDMVLAGKVNKEIVRRFRSCGVHAFGLCGADGGLFTGTSVDSVDRNRTAHVAGVDPRPLSILLDAGYVPVVASVSQDVAGWGLNVNADEAALEIAAALQARTLLFLSDTPGIVISGEVARRLTEREIEDAIASQAITGGMIPKARSSVAALKRGVSEIIIGEYRSTGDLSALLGGRSGTHIFL